VPSSTAVGPGRSSHESKIVALAAALEDAKRHTAALETEHNRTVVALKLDLDAATARASTQEEQIEALQQETSSLHGAMQTAHNSIEQQRRESEESVRRLEKALALSAKREEEQQAIIEGHVATAARLEDTLKQSSRTGGGDRSSPKSSCSGSGNRDTPQIGDCAVAVEV